MSTDTDTNTDTNAGTDTNTITITNTNTNCNYISKCSYFINTISSICTSFSTSSSDPSYFLFFQHVL